ncbi:MAG: hypothetical protein AAF649_11385 [Verrucomicrobiota bacterium]
MVTTKTKQFDAVAESRKWREATSNKLDSMTLQDRLAYLLDSKQQYQAKKRDIQPQATSS